MRPIIDSEDRHHLHNLISDIFTIINLIVIRFNIFLYSTAQNAKTVYQGFIASITESVGVYCLRCTLKLYARRH